MRTEAEKIRETLDSCYQTLGKIGFKKDLYGRYVRNLYGFEERAEMRMTNNGWVFDTYSTPILAT